MGKHQDRESLIFSIVKTIVHEIVARHTNRPESVHFLRSEVTEYRSQTEKSADNYNWNNEDRKYIEEKALKMIKERLAVKYSDVSYSEHELSKILSDFMEEVL